MRLDWALPPGLQGNYHKNSEQYMGHHHKLGVSNCTLDSLAAVKNDDPSHGKYCLSLWAWVPPAPGTKNQQSSSGFFSKSYSPDGIILISDVL